MEFPTAEEQGFALAAAAAAGDPEAQFTLAQHQQAMMHQQQAATMLCCQCGTQIQPNPAAMCVACIRSRVDITEGIPKQGNLYFCRSCSRYLSPPTTWTACDLESRELLAICLKRLKGLSQVRLIDAGFVWTEPHSKRIKVRVTIQKEVFTNTILQQAFVVEYVVANQMCTQCHRREANDTWNAVVQVRQKVRHMKTFFHLEQLIIKHHAHAQTIKIGAKSDGIDFFFASRSDAKRFVDFLEAVVPVRMKMSEQLISHDIQNNVSNFKFTFSVEIVPICKDDLVCLPASIARSNGNIRQIVLCDRIGTTLHFLDPSTFQHCEMTAPKFWTSPFSSISTQKQLVEFTVLDINPVLDPVTRAPIHLGKHAMAEAVVARVKDLGVNDVTFMVRTHLGNFLQPGDNAWGYDLNNTNYNNEHANKLRPEHIPDLILVKKSYSDRPRRRRRRWRLRHLDKETTPATKKEEQAAEQQYEQFLSELEEDKELRSTVNLYKVDGVPDTDNEEEDEELRVGVDELLDDFGSMQLEDVAMGPDDDDAEGSATGVDVEPMDF